MVVPVSKDVVNRCPCHQKLSTTIARAAPENNSAFDYEEPETAKEAIDLGLVLCKQEKYVDLLLIDGRVAHIIIIIGCHCETTCQQSSTVTVN
jgi:hypothetical protein